MHDLIELINSALPQYQCGRCDTPGCRPYAKEIAEGSPYNRCVPGGKETLDKLQAITKRPPLTLDDITPCIRFAEPTIASTGHASIHFLQPIHSSSTMYAICGDKAGP